MSVKERSRSGMIRAKGRFICSSHSLTTTSDQMELETLSIKYQHLTIPALKSVNDHRQPWSL
ncbi:hypothetical protein LINPERHAP2_LOCUS35581 [Linum perenne]